MSAGGFALEGDSPPVLFCEKQQPALPCSQHCFPACGSTAGAACRKELQVAVSTSWGLSLLKVPEG